MVSVLGQQHARNLVHRRRPPRRRAAVPFRQRLHSRRVFPEQASCHV